MTFPVVETSTGSLEDAANVTSHTVDLPSGVVSGDLLLAFFCSDGNPTITFPNEGTDWVVIKDIAGASNAIRLKIAYREADGTEGSTITVTTSSSERSAHVVRRISGHENPATQAPEVSTGTTGTSINPDPDSLTPTGGAKDYLWIAVEAHDRDRSFVGAPADYVSSVGRVGSTANSCGVRTIIRSLNAAAEDPGSFEISASDQWAAVTVAVHPAAAVAPVGIGDLRFEVMTVVAAGEADFVGAGILNFEAMSVAAVGVMQPDGVGALVIEAEVLSAVGEQPHEGVGALEMQVDELAAVGVQVFVATGAPEMQIQELATVGVQKFLGTAAPTMEVQELTTAGVMQPDGTAVLTIEVEELAAQGSVPFEGVTAAELEQFILAAVGEQPHEGVGALELEPESVAAVGVAGEVGASVLELAQQVLATTGEAGQPEGTATLILAPETMTAVGVMPAAGTTVVTMRVMVLSSEGIGGVAVGGAFRPIFRPRRR